jgi:lysozyme family protein
VSDLFYNVAVPHILKVEGGYVNDADDPGGETKYGISKAAWPNVDIASLTKDQAIEIYRKEYWVPTAGRIEDLSPEIALVIFDWAVNSGRKLAVMKLQEALHVTQDGDIGPKTRAALAGAANKQLLVTNLLAARAMFYTQLKTWAKFGLGWMRRLFTLTVCVSQLGKSVDYSALDEVIEKLRAIRNS